MAPRRDHRGNKAVAKAAGLHYVVEGEPGLSRIRVERRLPTATPKGAPCAMGERSTRIRSLVIPPAWEDVWICARADGHVQATGRDARGRKQHRYPLRVDRPRATDSKYGQMIDFAPRLRPSASACMRTLKAAPLSRAYVLATVVTLLEKTLIRIGNKEYARANNSFGLTTLLDQHVQIKGRVGHLSLPAPKSGVMQTIEVKDARCAASVRRCRQLPGNMLFQYVGTRRQSANPVDSGRGELRTFATSPDGQFTAKNFRTWAGTLLAAKAVCDLPECSSDAAFKRNIVRAGGLGSGEAGQHPRRVPEQLTIHPAVFDGYRDRRDLF
jgi:DNA topoisomerase-1